MVFNWNSQFDEEKGKSLASLVKYNNGCFKSDKQANFISRWACNFRVNENIKNTFANIGMELLEDGQYIIEVDASIRHAHGRGVVPITYGYVMDKHGVLKKYRIRYSRTSDTGYSPKSVEYVWVRDNNDIRFTPAPPTPAKAKEPVKVSSWVGTVGKREEFTVTVKRIIECETRYGFSDLYIMEDSSGNVLKWFTSSFCEMEQGSTYNIKATVKDHSEYNDVKETMLTRVKVC